MEGELSSGYAVVWLLQVEPDRGPRHTSAGVAPKRYSSSACHVDAGRARLPRRSQPAKS
jgi:hypothetical protein